MGAPVITNSPQYKAQMNVDVSSTVQNTTLTRPCLRETNYVVGMSVRQERAQHDFSTPFPIVYTYEPIAI